MQVFSLRLLQCLGLFALFSFAGCGRDHKGRPTKPVERENADEEKASPQAQPGVVRGRWEIQVELASDRDRPDIKLKLAGSKKTHTINGTVQAAVSFEISDAKFTEPVAVDVASYGHIDITSLRDNSLRVCGNNGKEKCTLAGLRLYTTGTPEGGLWNTVEDYGAPILTDSKTVGLDIANAVSLGTVVIDNQKRLVRLKDFTTATELQVPISVDFTEAPAGIYASTLVLEYYLAKP